MTVTLMYKKINSAYLLFSNLLGLVEGYKHIARHCYSRTVTTKSKCHLTLEWFAPKDGFDHDELDVLLCGFNFFKGIIIVFKSGQLL